MVLPVSERLHMEYMVGAGVATGGHMVIALLAR